MSAKCQACQKNIGSIQNYIGNLNEPLGVCANCSSLTCGHHGLRDTNRKKAQFVCAECVQIAMVASTVQIAGADPDVSQLVLAAYHLGVPERDQPPYASLEDFKESWRGFKEEFYEKVEDVYSDFSRSGERTPFYIDDEDRGREAGRLLVAAVLIGNYLEFPRDETPAYLLEVDRALRRSGSV